MALTDKSEVKKTTKEGGVFTLISPIFCGPERFSAHWNRLPERLWGRFRALQGSVARGPI